jgi:Flp pilus assembly pilin Flp
MCRLGPHENRIARAAAGGWSRAIGPHKSRVHGQLPAHLTRPRMPWHMSCPLDGRRAVRQEGVTVFRTLDNARQMDAREANTMEFINRLRTIVNEEYGQDLLEYALLVALIALVAAGAVGLAGQSVQTVFNNIVAAIPA